MPKTPKIDSAEVVSVVKASVQPKSKANSDGYMPHPNDISVIKSIQNSYHSKALHFKATSNVGIGFDVYGKGGQVLETIPKILTEANPFEAFQEVIMKVALDFEEAGDGYLEVVRDKKGLPAELYWMPAETVQVSKDKSKYRQKVNRKEAFFVPYGQDTKGGEFGEIIPFHYPSNKSSYYGTPDWLGCVGPILLDQFAVQWNHNFFKNNAVPSYAIIIEGGEMTPEVEKRIKDFLTQNLKGVENAHKALLLPIKNPNVKVKFEEIMKRPTDGGFEKLRNQIRDEIISAHGVPPRLLGVVTAGSLGGGGEAQQQLHIFKEISIAPKQRLFESVINRTIGRDLDFVIDFRSINIDINAEDENNQVDIGAIDTEKGAAELLEKIMAIRKMVKDAEIAQAIA